jgi:hypothetical protein
MNTPTKIQIPRGFSVESRPSITGKNTVYRVTSRLGAIGDNVDLGNAVAQCRYWHDEYLRRARNDRRAAAHS